MRHYYLIYWSKEPNRILVKEVKTFRNNAEAYKYILFNHGLAILVTENKYYADSIVI